MAKKIIILNGSPRKKEIPPQLQQNLLKVQQKQEMKLKNSCFRQ